MHRENGSIDMNLTRENYEFLMFELLEGNLNESEKSSLLVQINKDAFYKREWSLMQQTLIFPDSELVMLDKQSLLKPDGRNRFFMFLSPALKIAASIILFGTIGWWYYSANNNLTITKNISNESAKPESIIIKIPTDNKIEVKQNDVDDRNINVSKKNVSYPHKTYLTMKVEQAKDTNILSPDVPDIFMIKPLTNDKIAYNISPNEVFISGILQIEKPKFNEPNKFLKLLTQIEIIKSTANEYWNDIPNLRLKVTPKLKERNIGIELKGETIYANALIEIK